MKKRIIYLFIILFGLQLNLNAQDLDHPDCENIPDKLTSDEHLCDGGTVTECLIDNGLVMDGCSESPDPYISDNFCQDGLGIARYLQRSAMGVGLTDLNFKQACEGQVDPSPAIDAIVNCDAPYAACSSNYCPDTYCAQIQALVDMNVQFVSRAASVWFKEWWFRPGSELWNAQAQFTCDVNAAYDCAGLPRPVLQAGIFEGIGVTPRVQLDKPQLDKILCALNLSYSDLPLVHFKEEGPINAEGLNLPFKFNRLAMSNEAGYEISNVETQIWFMFQAMTYIDMGYTALHMGDFQSYTNTDPGLHDLSKVLDAIRVYADEQGSMIVMNGEGGNAKKEGTDKFLFDFSSIPASFQEEDTAHNTSTEQCAAPEDTSIFNEDTPCNNPDDQALAAYINKCVLGTHFSETEISGESPSGCYVDEMPFYIYTDHGHGAVLDPETCELDESIMNQPTSENGPLGSHWGASTYGYDDSRWFGNELSPECRSYFFQSYYCSIKELYPNASILIPLQLRVKFPEYADCGELGDPYTSNGLYVMSDEPDFINGMVALMDPVLPEVSITNACKRYEQCFDKCDDQLAPPNHAWWKGANYVNVEVTNPDCSSIYSIHVKGPDGNFLPYKEGTSYSFEVTQTGEYIITIRQDNLGFDANEDTNGNGTVSTTFTEYFETSSCCLPIPRGLCYERFFTKRCTEENNLISKYDFEIEFEDPSTRIGEIKMNTARMTLSNLNYERGYKATGTITMERFTDPGLQLEVYAVGSRGENIRRTIEDILECTELVEGRSLKKSENNKLSNLMRVYPVPINLSKELVVEFPFNATSEYSFEVLNIFGERVIALDKQVVTNGQQTSINLKGLPVGTYFLKMNDLKNQESHTAKIVVIN